MHLPLEKNTLTI